MSNFKAGLDSIIQTGKVFFRKHGSTILFWGGIGTVIGGTVLACNATLKVPDIIAERDKQIDDIKQNQIADTTGSTAIDIPTEKETNHQIMMVHGKTALAIGKEYIPAAIVGGIGIAMLTKSHHDLRKRYLALSAAYTGLQAEFMSYRNGVRKRFGDDVDRELIFGVEQKKLEFVDTETGEVKEEDADVVSLSKFGKMTMETTVLFDEKSSLWEDNANFNRRIIDLVFYNANEKLRKRGEAHDNLGAVLFVNEINDALDLPRTASGNVLGWKYDPNNPAPITYDILSAHQVGDDYILYTDENEPNMWIRYNVHGNVLEAL